MKSIISFSRIIIFATSMLLLLAGCSKNEQAVDEPVFTGLRVKVICADTFLLKLVANEQVLLSEFEAPALEDVSASVQYVEPRQHITLFDYYRNTIVADTVITYKTGFINRLTFYQAEKGAALQFLGPPVNEPKAPDGFGKLSINYTYAPLPDSVKVVVENTGPSDNIYKETESFILKRGVFSKFFEGRFNGTKPRLKLYTTDVTPKQVAQIDSDQFSGMNPDFSQFIFRISLSGGGIAFLDGERLY